MTTLLKCAVFIVVLLAPGQCKNIKVCLEEDNDIRIDCNIEAKTNQINTYTFIMSVGSKELIINTNSTTGKVDDTLKSKSTVQPLETGGLRLRLKSLTVPENRTFTCRSNTLSETVFVEKGKMIPCSTISVFLHGCSGLFYLLLSLYAMQSWELVTL